MLAGIESTRRHPGVIADGAVDVNAIDIGIAQQRFKIRVPFRDSKLVPQSVHLRFIATAQCHDFGIGMRLVDRNELGTKTKSHHRNSD